MNVRPAALVRAVHLRPIRQRYLRHAQCGCSRRRQNVRLRPVLLLLPLMLLLLLLLLLHVLMLLSLLLLLQRRRSAGRATPGPEVSILRRSRLLLLRTPVKLRVPGSCSRRRRQQPLSGGIPHSDSGDEDPCQDVRPTALQ